MELTRSIFFTKWVGPDSLSGWSRFLLFLTTEDSSTDEYTTSVVADINDEMVTLLKKVVNVSQSRDDYMEFLELAIIFLGSVPPRGIHFVASGAIHHAWWMAKAIYSFKLWMFCLQFELTACQITGLQNSASSFPASMLKLGQQPALLRAVTLSC